MVILISWFRRFRRDRVKSAWDAHWEGQRPYQQAAQEERPSGEEREWNFSSAEGLLQEWEHRAQEGNIPVSQEELNAFRELLNAWETFVKGGHSEVPELTKNIDEHGAVSSVEQVRRLLQLWAAQSEEDLPISPQQLSEFQRLLLNWEDFMRRKEDQNVPRSYTQPRVGSVYYGIHGTDDAAAMARMAQNHIIEMSERMAAGEIPEPPSEFYLGMEKQIDGEIYCGQDVPLPDEPQMCNGEQQLANHVEKLPKHLPSMNSDSIVNFLPENVVLKGERLNEMWNQGLLNRSQCNLERAPHLRVMAESAYLDGSTNRRSPHRFNAGFMSRTGGRRTPLRQVLWRRSLDERDTRFIASLSLRATRHVLSEILDELGPHPVVLKNNGRKLKVFLPIDGSGMSLVAVLSLESVALEATRVTFRRSREDRGRTSCRDFVNCYNKVYLRFLSATTMTDSRHSYGSLSDW